MRAAFRDERVCAILYNYSIIVFCSRETLERHIVRMFRVFKNDGFNVAYIEFKSAGVILMRANNGRNVIISGYGADHAAFYSFMIRFHASLLSSAVP